MRFDTYTDYILNFWLKSAIHYGIPYETFWAINPRIMTIYQDVYISKSKEKFETMNYYTWLQGQYCMFSIGASMSKKCRYPQKPFDFDEVKENTSPEEGFKLWIEEFNKRFEEK